MFISKRLHPWVPEHAVFIKGELAMLEVTDPSAAATYRAFYEQKALEAPVEPEKQELAEFAANIVKEAVEREEAAKVEEVKPKKVKKSK